MTKKNRRKRPPTTAESVTNAAQNDTVVEAEQLTTPRRKEHHQCQGDRLTASVEEITSCVNSSHRVLVLMRGLAGSGKSTLARSLLCGHDGLMCIFSTDDYFVNAKTGVYEHDFTRLQNAHDQNLKRVRRALDRQTSPVIVDNTNIYVAHMMNYARLAVEAGYEVYTITPTTAWKNKVGECSRRSKHDVATKVNQKWLDEFEKCESVERLTGSLGVNQNARVTFKTATMVMPPTVTSQENPESTSAQDDQVQSVDEEELVQVEPVPSTESVIEDISEADYIRESAGAEDDEASQEVEDVSIMPYPVATPGSILQSLMHESSNSWASLVDLGVSTPSPVPPGLEPSLLDRDSPSINMSPLDSTPSTVTRRSMGTQCEELAIMIALHATYDRDVGHPDMSHTAFPNDEGLDIGEEEDRRERRPCVNGKHRMVETECKWPPYVLTVITMRFEQIDAETVLNLLNQHNDNIATVCDALIHNGVYSIPQTPDLHSLMYDTQYAVALYDPFTTSFGSEESSVSSGYTTDNPLDNPYAEFNWNATEEHRAPSSSFSLADCLPAMSSTAVADTSVDEAIVEDSLTAGLVVVVQQYDDHQERRAWHRALKLVSDPTEVTGVHAAKCLREQTLVVQVDLLTTMYTRLDPVAHDFDRSGDLFRVLDRMRTALQAYWRDNTVLTAEQKQQELNDRALAELLNDELNLHDNAPRVMGDDLTENEKVNRLQLAYPQASTRLLRMALEIACFSLPDAFSNLQYELGEPKSGSFVGVANNGVKSGPPPVLFGNIMQAPPKAPPKPIKNGEVFTGTANTTENANEYTEQREKAFALDAEAKEMHRRAAHYMKSKMPSVAQYYARQASELTTKSRRLHRQTAEEIAANRARRHPSNVLDLHTLHQDEALSLAVKTIKQREVPFHHYDGRVLKIITGRGKNSTGAAKIRPAVKAWLRNNNRQYNEEPEGQFNVKLIKPAAK